MKRREDGRTTAALAKRRRERTFRMRRDVVKSSAPDGSLTRRN
jgi:hypothetical protein